MARQYKIEVVTEGALGTLFVGSSKLPVKKMEKLLNDHGRDGWEMEFMVIEKKRMALLWEREAAVITLSRSV
jgi:hypothetical protein